MNIAQFLTTLILKKICEQLLLPLLLLTGNISSYGLDCALNLISPLQRSSSRFKEFSLGCLVVNSSFYLRKRKISRNGRSLSLVVTRFHLLSLVVTRCTIHLSFYKRSCSRTYIKNM